MIDYGLHIFDVRDVCKIRTTFLTFQKVTHYTVKTGSIGSRNISGAYSHSDSAGAEEPAGEVWYIRLPRRKSVTRRTRRVTGQLADTPTRGLPTRGLDNSRTSQRNRLSDKLCERLLMLKTNKQFRWRWSGITYYLHLKNSCLSSSCMLFMWTICGRWQWIVKWFVWPILFAAIIQNFKIGGVASHSLLKKYLKYLNTMCSI